MNRRIFLAVANTLLFIALTISVGAEPTASPTPSASDLQASIDSAREPIFDGLGSLHHPVTTKTNSTLAQRFFDQGLTFVYAFNHDEAAGSFEQAAHLDPNMAMAYWGIALSLGPNINLPEDTDRGKTAYAAIVQAKSLEENASAAEREYIDALAQRYAPDGKMNDGASARVCERDARSCTPESRRPRRGRAVRRVDDGFASVGTLDARRQAG